MTTLAPDSFHEAKSFDGLDLRGGRLERVELLDCVISDSQLSEATLDSCSFEDVTFRRCDLSVVQLGGTAFRGVKFDECKLTGLDWSRAQDLTFEVSFHDCVLDFSSFQGVRLRKLRIEGGRAHNVIFADSDLRAARLGYVDLAGAQFTGNDLRGTDLSTSVNVVLEPRTNRLHKTKLPVDAALKHLKQMGIIVPGMQQAKGR
ncbi:MAG: pentapeptide repeat-containing protein [Proteobacteria bacterium]|nr:pentapeptide repeat-containing protein [Pseudomonadota bacterium]